MRGLIAVARREFAEHRIVLAAALASGILTAIVVLLPPAVRNPRSEIREIGALFVGSAFAAGVALALGFSTLAGRLAGRRFGFYFARPLSHFQIWGGPLAGVAALALAAGAAGAFPGLAANGRWPNSEVWGVRGIMYGLSVAVLFPLAQILGLSTRSRTSWAALDLAVIVVAVTTATFAARLLIRRLAMDALGRGLAALGIVALAAILAASYAAVSRGRTEFGPAHRAMSLTFGGLLLGGVMLFAGYALWTVSPRMAELRPIAGVPGPHTSWVYTAGYASGRGDLEAEFLFEIDTGRRLHIWNGGRPVLFAADGSRAVWCEPYFSARGFAVLARPWGSIQGDACRVMELDLRSSSAPPRTTDIVPTGVPWYRAVSADGSRVALVTAERGLRTLSVYDLHSSALVGAVVLPPAERLFVVFDGPLRVRVYADLRSGGRPGEIQVLLFDIAARRMEEIGRIAPDNTFRFLRVSPDHSRILVVSSRGVALWGAAGERPVLLSEGPRWSRNAMFLADGRVAVTEGDAAGTRVRLFSADGLEQKTIAIGPPGRINLGAEARPGVLVLARRPDNASLSDDESFVVDLRSGEVRSLGRRLTPAATTMGWVGDDPTYRLSPGDPGTSLFLEPRAGRLLSINLQTGQRRVLLGKS